MGSTIPEGKNASIFTCAVPNSPPGSQCGTLVCQKMQMWVPKLEEIALDTEYRQRLINQMCLQEASVL